MALLPKFTLKEKEAIELALSTIKQKQGRFPVIIQGTSLIRFNQAVEKVIKEKYQNVDVSGTSMRLKVDLKK